MRERGEGARGGGGDVPKGASTRSSISCLGGRRVSRPARPFVAVTPGERRGGRAGGGRAGRDRHGGEGEGIGEGGGGYRPGMPSRQGEGKGGKGVAPRGGPSQGCDTERAAGSKSGILAAVGW